MASASFSTCKLMLRRNRGIILIILWSLSELIVLNFGISSVFYDNKYDLTTGEKLYTKIASYIIVILTTLLCPVLGWVADVYWGRYKMIRRSLFIMWLATIALGIVSVLPNSLPNAAIIKEVSNIALFAALLFSLGAVQTNIVQFGIDQMPDASSANITSFSNWYIWVWCASFTVVTFSSNCVCSKYTAVAKLLLPACTTLALCLDYNCNHWLIKEPASSNPLKLIYRVMCFAWKNKYPCQRSAFTYCDDKHYSRIDFAKQKFGGPHTTEQVEDVKTFWRILLIFLIYALYIGFINNNYIVANGLRYQLRNRNLKQESVTNCSTESISNCFQRETAYNVGYLVSIVIVPLYQLVPYRFIEAKVSVFMRFNAGLFLGFISMVGYLILEVTGHMKMDANSTNITCLLTIEKDNYSIENSFPLDYKWMMFPDCLSVFSNFFMLSAVIQFVCAQSPYSMKGLIFGLSFGVFGFSFFIVHTILLQPIVHTVHKWPPNRYGCGTWYLLAASIVLLLIFAITCFLSWKYKKRQRGDVLPNEHIFAINYYSRYTMYNAVES